MFDANVSMRNLHAWTLRHTELKEKEFSELLANIISLPQRTTTLAVHKDGLAGFNTWAKKHGLDGSNPSITMLAEFFEYLFDENKLGQSEDIRQLCPGNFPPTNIMVLYWLLNII